MNSTIAKTPSPIHFPLDKATLPNENGIASPTCSYFSQNGQVKPIDYNRRPELTFSPKNSTIQFHVSQYGVVTISLDRPTKRNAISMGMVEDLYDVLQFLFQKQHLYRCVIITSTSSDFCGGLDLITALGLNPKASEDEKKRKLMKEAFTQYDPRNTTYSQYDFNRLPDPTTSSPSDFKYGHHNILQHLCLGWQMLSLPVISVVNGVVFGAAIQIIFGADIRLFTKAATASILETKWGLVGDMGLMGMARGVIKEDQLRFLLWSGKMIRGDDLVKYSISTYPEVFDDMNSLATTLNAFVNNILWKAPEAIIEVKRLANETSPFNSKLSPYKWGYNRENGRRIHFEPHQLSIYNIEQARQIGLFLNPNQHRQLRANLKGKLAQFIVEVVDENGQSYPVAEVKGSDPGATFAKL